MILDLGETLVKIFFCWVHLITHPQVIHRVIHRLCPIESTTYVFVVLFRYTPEIPDSFFSSLRGGTGGGNGKLVPLREPPAVHHAVDIGFRGCAGVVLFNRELPDLPFGNRHSVLLAKIDPENARAGPEGPQVQSLEPYAEVIFLDGYKTKCGGKDPREQEMPIEREMPESVGQSENIGVLKGGGGGPVDVNALDEGCIADFGKRSAGRDLFMRIGDERQVDDRKANVRPGQAAIADLGIREVERARIAG